jgi:hypothetical protein
MGYGTLLAHVRTTKEFCDFEVCGCNRRRVPLRTSFRAVSSLSPLLLLQLNDCLRAFSRIRTEIQSIR